MTNPRDGRGNLLDPAVMAEIASASSGRQWRIAAAVAQLALESLQTRPPQLDAALSEIRSGRRDPTTQKIVADVAERLDQLYLEMYDDAKPGGPTAGWESVFSQARAVASLGSYSTAIHERLPLRPCTRPFMRSEAT